MKKFLTILLILSAQTVCFATETTTINNGRYVMYMNPQFRGDQFVLDTQTGKIWQMVSTKDGAIIFQQMLYDCYNNDKTYSGSYTTPR